MYNLKLLKLTLNMANFDMSYVLYGLVIAALAIVIIYFSKVEEDEPKKNNIKKPTQLQIEDKSEIEQLKARLNEQIIHHDREYQQTLIQVREAENSRKNEYTKQVDNLRSIEAKLIREKDEFMKEKQEFLQQKIDFQKQQLDGESKKSSKTRKSRKSNESG